MLFVVFGIACQTHNATIPNLFTLFKFTNVSNPMYIYIYKINNILFKLCF